MNAIVGICQSTYTDNLKKVPVHRNRKPVLAFDGLARIGPHARRYVEHRWGRQETFDAIAKNLPLRAMTRLTLDEICKARFSSFIMMDGTVEDLFKKDPRYRVVEKITNSMWRWGMGKSTWNDVVDSYDGLRNFSLDVPGFEIRVDHTTGWNPRGLAEHSDTYLDGVFAFLVYYRGEHVMTIGFSFMNGRRLLIQQVQMKQRRGNRFLFKLPPNYLEMIVERFKAAFPKHALYIVNGKEIALKSFDSYRDGRDDTLALALKYEERDQSDPWNVKRAADYRAKVVEFKEKMAHIKGDLERLRAFYADTGRFQQGKVLNVNGLVHYAVTEG